MVRYFSTSTFGNLYLVEIGINLQVILSTQVVIHARKSGEDTNCAADLGILLANVEPIDNRSAKVSQLQAASMRTVVVFPAPLGPRKPILHLR